MRKSLGVIHSDLPKDRNGQKYTTGMENTSVAIVQLNL